MFLPTAFMDVNTLSHLHRRQKVDSVWGHGAEESGSNNRLVRHNNEALHSFTFHQTLLGRYVKLDKVDSTQRMYRRQQVRTKF
jgi:hypothetical protein